MVPHGTLLAPLFPFAASFMSGCIPVEPSLLPASMGGGSSQLSGLGGCLHDEHELAEAWEPPQAQAGVAAPEQGSPLPPQLLPQPRPAHHWLPHPPCASWP